VSTNPFLNPLFSLVLVLGCVALFALRHLTVQLGNVVGLLLAMQQHLVEIRNTLRDLPVELREPPRPAR
jgi:hypothetical protein